MMALTINVAQVFFHQSQILRVVQDTNRGVSLGRFANGAEAEAYITSALGYMTDEITAFARRFRRDEEGTFTVFALYIVLISLMVGGMAIDFNELIADRTRLQVTADSVGRAALQLRQTKSAD